MKRLFVPAIFLLFCLFPSTGIPLTIDEELKYGREIHREILRNSKLCSDYALAFFLEDLKRSLERYVSLPYPVRMIIVDSSAVDAFATIGGYIYLTTSLISLCETEDELSGVIAHELAHIAKRHVAKRLEKEKLLNVGRVATILLAMLSGDPKVQEALITSGMGAIQAASLFYSREDEKEADLLAQIILERSGYNCRGISDFLKKLRALGRETKFPQYLLTHPYPEERIARLSTICREEIKSERPKALFEYISERVRILTHRSRTELLSYYEKNYEKNKDQRSLIGLSLLYSLLGRKTDALESASKIEGEIKSLVLAEVLFLVKDYRAAIEHLERSDFSFAKYILARSYEEIGDLDRARLYYEELKEYGEIFPDIYYRLSMIYGREKNEARGFEYLGRFHLACGRESEAKNFFRRALSLYGKESREAQEIKRILTDLEKI